MPKKSLDNKKSRLRELVKDAWIKEKFKDIQSIKDRKKDWLKILSNPKEQFTSWKDYEDLGLTPGFVKDHFAAQIMKIEELLMEQVIQGNHVIPKSTINKTSWGNFCAWYLDNILEYNKAQIKAEKVKIRAICNKVAKQNYFKQAWEKYHPNSKEPFARLEAGESLYQTFGKSKKKRKNKSKTYYSFPVKLTDEMKKRLFDFDSLE